MKIHNFFKAQERCKRYNVDKIFFQEDESLLGRAPMVGLKEKLKATKKANRYLYFQEKRIKKLLENKEYDNAVVLWLLILKNSKSYQTILFHRVKSSWYRLKSFEDSISDLKVAMNNLREWNMKFLLKRFYVIKSKNPDRNGLVWKDNLEEGERLRPIGSPDITSAMISKALTNLVTVLHEKERGNTQHGYRPKKGVHSALKLIITKYLEMRPSYIIEFDFKSFFNKVSINWVRGALSEKSVLLSSLISSLIVNTTYIFKRLEKESELRIIGKKKIRTHKKRKDYLVIERSGMPQGLSLSPLVCTLALEYGKLPEGLIMYADDGIFMGHSEKDFDRFISGISSFGVSLDKYKTKVIDPKVEFKFLGCTINLSEQTIKYKESIKKFTDKDIDYWLQTVTSKYGKKPEKWNWEIVQGACILQHKISWKTLGIWSILLTFINSRMSKSYKGIRHIWRRGFVDVIHSSSYCVNTLLVASKDFDLSKKREMTIPVFGTLKIYGVKKNNYIENYSLRWSRTPDN